MHRLKFANVVKGLALGAAALAMVMSSPKEALAAELETNIVISTGGDGKKLHDEMYSTYTVLDSGDYVEIIASEGIKGIYVVWNKPVKEWSLKSGAGEMICGKDGFIHEYVELDGQTKSVRITSQSNGMELSEVYACGAGELPENFQNWQKPCENADIMIFPAHADDEILFFGGIMPTYIDKGARVQIVYMTQFWDTTSIREHEKLDGLWVSGVRNYPVNPEFTDLYSETLDGARSQYDSEAITEYMVENIRRFKPSVVVAHDFKGEYGHGYHMLTADCLSKAVELTGKSTEYTESATKYGVWDVPKTYIHLYEKNQITLNLRTPIKSMGNKTALEIAKAAYKMHWSQQWTWYFVDDGLDEDGKPNDYKYSCAKFGLYRTTVGADTGNDMLENVRLYADIEAENKKLAEEEASKQALEEQKKIEEESKRIKESEQAKVAEENAKAKADKDVGNMIKICIAIIILIVSALLLVHILTGRRVRRAVRRRRNNRQ
ncbi:MAG TPA: PIG-L family deacetylase [Eubacterium sp.]|nr:PIG-L family deacetylase [Eubacterium sp.]